ncbi:hypothetical protein HD553DRAFT_275609, partial [Filobasidium floriforme]|uniref:uncharacterized protein n=1 Tax=Filobasidium floriforme TaxID=5210 RepID=UPI001E8E4E18
EDEASCHSCKLAKEAQTRLEISSLVYSHTVPDLNLIWSVRHLLKTELPQLLTQTTNLDMLLKQVQACWVDIDQGFVDKLIDDMPVRG